MTTTESPLIDQPPQPTPPPRKRHRARWIIGGTVATVATIAAGGLAIGLTAAPAGNATHSTTPAAPAAPSAPPSVPPAPSSPPSQGPNVGYVGDTMTITQDGQPAAEITITSVNVTTAPSDQYGPAPKNGYFVTAHVRIKVLGGYNGGVDISSYDFYAKTGTEHYNEGNGNAYDAPGGMNEISADSLGAGETAGGTLVFDMPRQHGQIGYAPNFEGGAIGYWKF